MKRLIPISMLLCLITGGFPPAARSEPLAKGSISTYEQLEARAGEASELLKKEHGLTVQILLNPQYLASANAATLSGTGEWIQAIAKTVGTLAQQKEKLGELQEKARMVVIVPFKDEEPMNTIDRVRGGVTIGQTLSGLAKPPPENFSERFRQALFDPTPKDKLDAALAELAPLRGKITAPLSATQAGQLALLAVNVALLKAARLVLVMQDLDKPFQTESSLSLSQLAKDRPKRLAQRVRAAIASLPRELTADFRHMQKETYSDSATITVHVKKTLTDSLIKEGLELVRSRPAGVPDLASKLTAEGLWKSILFYSQERDGLAEAPYFERLDSWGSLMPLEDT